jgi:hypothetical protein
MGEGMKFGREILGLLLIAALVMATTTLATDAWAEPNHTASAPAQSPAGCHAHTGKSLPDSQNSRSPRPAPVSYQCCLTGHDAAAVRASFVPQPSGHCHCQCAHLALRVEPALTACCSRDLMVLSADLPGPTPLRI